MITGFIKKAFITILLSIPFFFVSYSQSIRKEKCEKFSEAISTGILKKKLKNYDDSIAILRCLHLKLSDTLYNNPNNIENALNLVNRIVRKESSLAVKQSGVDIYISILMRKPSNHLYNAILQLQKFDKNCYDSADIRLLANYIENVKSSIKELVLVAGALNDSLLKNKIKGKLSDETLKKSDRWAIHLALARMGEQESIDYLKERVNSLQLNSNVVDYIYKDLIYTRQKVLYDLIVEKIFSDEKLCESSNPDSEVSILCGYRILELIAPYIDGFPIKTLPSGDLNVESYENALITAREWFLNNKMNYQIIKN